MTTPDCTACRYRRRVAGTHHLACAHPVAEAGGPSLALVVHMTAGLHVAAEQHGVSVPLFDLEVNQHGLDQGWADWPARFDPIWIRRCTGFKEPIASLVTEGGRHEG